MFNGKKILCIIPARAGSCGLPGKNVLPIAGKPMIAHAIEKALRVQEIDRIIVSTDSPMIADIARSHGAEAPFLRSSDLARDESPMIPVIVDAVDRLEVQGSKYDYAVMLQANSPHLQSDEIQAVINKIVLGEYDVVFTVCEISHPPQWSLCIDSVEPQFAFSDVADMASERRQEMDVCYRSTGAVYAVSIPYLLENEKTARLCLPASNQRSAVVVTSQYSGVDVDTELDYLLAKAIFERNASDDS